jgi:alanine racemase
MIHLRDLASVVEGKLSDPNAEDAIIEHVLTDSRKHWYHPNTIFVALQGESHNGEAYIEDLYARGMRYFLCTQRPENCPQATCIIVPNTRDALQKWAKFHRENLKLPILAITGSNGKTIVKEWAATLLSSKYSVVKSPRSFNSQVGVPLSVLLATENHSLGVFEAGISQPNEMQNLAKILQPQYGIFTNIGEAHQANFLNIEEKIHEKARVFNNCEWVLTKNDSKIIAALKALDNPPKVLVCSQDFGFKQEKNGVSIEFEKFREDYNLPFADIISIENLSYAIIAARLLGVSQADIQHHLMRLQSVEMRMEFLQGPGSRVVVNDAYSSDLSSLQLALEQLHTYRPESQKSLIITDFVQSDNQPERLYRIVGERLAKYPFREIIAIGDESLKHQAFFPENTHFYLTTEEALAKLELHNWGNDTILVKGARKFGLERLVYRLARQTHRTTLDINFSAMERNLRFIRKNLPENVKLMAMVKAFSYGVGSIEMARFLAYQKVDYLAVAIIDEGIELRKAGIQLPILVLNPDPSGFFLMSEYRLEPEIYTLDNLLAWKSATAQLNDPSPVHLKFDTGMHRLGFNPNELDEVLKEVPSLRIASVMSHLAASENPDFDSSTAEQIALLDNISRSIRAKTTYPFLTHILNTSGILRHPNGVFDMVRLGIGMYGVGNTELSPALQWRAHILQIRHLSKEEKIGYGWTQSLEKDGKIAVISAGYADGLRRSLSNAKGKVFIQGKACAFIGKISMDMSMVDISGVDCQVGDEVEIIGPNQSLEDLAKSMDTIPYEVLTGISPRVQRVYFRE